MTFSDKNKNCCCLNPQRSGIVFGAPNKSSPWGALWSWVLSVGISGARCRSAAWNRSHWLTSWLHLRIPNSFSTPSSTQPRFRWVFFPPSFFPPSGQAQSRLRYLPRMPLRTLISKHLLSRLPSCFLPFSRFSQPIITPFSLFFNSHLQDVRQDVCCPLVKLFLFNLR